MALPAGFSDTVVLSGLINPSAVRFAPDGRIFVAEKRGVVKVFDGLFDQTATVVADLRTYVHNFWDRGLLGLELDPDLATRPYLYVLYTYDAAIGATAPRWGTAGTDSDGCPTPPGATSDGCVVGARLSRLEIGPGNVMTGQERVLLEDWCQQYPSHSIGSLAFGRDKALYVSGGDGASFTFVDYGQDGQPLNPCGDPTVGVGGTQTAPTAEGGALRSQDLRTSGDPAGLNGAILRVDPDTGAAFAGNPLASSPDANARRVIATGLRNPFRITIRPGTDELWLGDVGWNDWEEINLVADVDDGAVENFGWPCYEGSGRQSGYDGANLNVCEQLYSAGTSAVAAPYYTYNHANKVVTGETCPTGSSSISGMAFRPTTGGTYPAAYNGAAFFADYSRDCIWVMRAGANGRPDPATRSTFVAGAANPVDVQVGTGGDVFYVDFDGGTVHRLRYGTAPAECSLGQFSAEYYNNRTLTPPLTSTRCEAAISNDWGTGGPGMGLGTDNFSVRWTGTFAFAAGAYDFTTRADDGVRLWLDGSIVIDNWVDQGATTTTVNRVVTAGQHVVKVEYYENGGVATATAGWTSATANQPPTVTLAAPLASTAWKVGDLIAFSGSATDPEQGPLPGSSLSWTVLLHHCPSTCHTHTVQTFTGASGTFTAPDHDYPSHLEFRVTATDDGGATDTESVLVQPSTVPLSFQTAPAGLQLTMGSTTAPTPFTRTVIVGSTNSLSAPTPQTLAGVPYVFSAWSDGGAQTHNVVAPAAAGSFTATYAVAPDTTPPVISNVRVTNIRFSSATITWTTNEPSDTRVDYGRTTALGSSTADPALVTTHTRNLTGLARWTLYYYRVRSADALGNASTSSIASFRTSLL